MEGTGTSVLVHLKHEQKLHHWRVEQAYKQLKEDTALSNCVSN